MDLSARIKELAIAQGFDLAGIAPAVEADGFPRFLAWLDQGMHGEMAYLARLDMAHSHPASIFPEVKSVLVTAINYKPSQEEKPAANFGRVARYAGGADYHDILHEKLNRLLEQIRSLQPGIEGRGVVDTAPLLERDFARRAGLGWFGKNTMLINPRQGSYLLLGALLLNIELTPDPPFETRHCGSCTACLSACPTEAFPQPGVLDARKCISYLTIELKGAIAEEFRPGMGDWVFGCDICQEVCPWNRKPSPGENWREFRDPAMERLNLVELLRLSEEEFRHRFRDTPMWRPRQRGILRNACIALGNTGNPEALPDLEQACLNKEPLVREAAQWAIDRINERFSIF
ncbi:MAG: tRNA epoxyqueuosine(34) reductase QueG [Gemmataceae bacterium]|nr:tRNA epoxyqueuosine(34) reductase QueG [Gemmataceae bacterium]